MTQTSLVLSLAGRRGDDVVMTCSGTEGRHDGGAETLLEAAGHLVRPAPILSKPSDYILLSFPKNTCTARHQTRKTLPFPETETN